jgi:hypothetical protein
VREGIDSISLNPDAVLKTSMVILEEERKGAAEPRSFTITKNKVNAL